MRMTEDSSASRQIDLRRADWRFLLPGSPEGSYRHLVLLGGLPGLAERLLTAGIARRVSEQLPAESPPDLVVILHDAAIPATVRRAISALAPGGTLYCEVDRRSSGSLMMTPSRMRRLLQEHAMSLTGLYWPLPAFTSGKRYVPLDVNGPLSWYFTTLYVDGAPSHQLFKRVVQTLTSYRSARFSRLVPWYSLTASTGIGATPSVLGHADCPQGLRRSGARPFLVTMGIDEGSRVAILPFTDGAQRPDIVFKVARLPEVNANVESEQCRLAEMRARLNGSMRRSVPEPLGRFSYGDLAVGIESCAPGQPLLVSSGRWRSGDSEKVDDLQLAAGWLGAFHQQVQAGPPEQGSADLIRRIEHILACYVDAFGIEPSEERLFAKVRARAHSLTDVPLPIVWQHGDFGPWNIYRAKNDVTVIDWEVRQGPILDPAGPPLCDLLYFVTYWSFVARRLYGDAAELRGFHELFLEPDRSDAIVVAIWAAIEEYLTRLAVDRCFVSVLLVYTWVKRALEDLHRHRVLDQLSGSRRAGNQFVNWIGLLAARTDLLFSIEHGVDAAGAKRKAGCRRVVSQ
jgi:hypothetical protein